MIDVTRFWGEIDSILPVCHISSQISEPPFQNDVTCLRTPHLPQSSGYCLHD